MSFGYETQVPPINTLAFFNAIANDGKMVRPMFTKEILHNGKTVQSFSTEVINSSICSDHTLALIKDMLLGVVEKGTGKAVHSDISFNEALTLQQILPVFYIKYLLHIQSP